MLLVYMCWIVFEDVVIGGKKICKGDKVVMWYVFGNCDEEVIDNLNEFIIDCVCLWEYLLFGFGIY